MLWDLGPYAFTQRCSPLRSASSFTLRCTFSHHFLELPFPMTFTPHLSRNTLTFTNAHFPFPPLWIQPLPIATKFFYMQLGPLHASSCSLTQSRTSNMTSVQVLLHTSTDTELHPWRAHVSSLHMPQQLGTPALSPMIPSPVTVGNGMSCHRGKRSAAPPGVTECPVNPG